MTQASGAHRHGVESAITRRRFVEAASAALAFVVVPGRRAWGSSLLPHPTPRPGITAAKVLTAKDLANRPRLIPLFDAVRAIPQVADGIRCRCGCDDKPEFYSLLSCFEGKGMARDCYACQSLARLVTRLHREGKSLEEIRAAVDAES